MIFLSNDTSLSPLFHEPPFASKVCPQHHKIKKNFAFDFLMVQSKYVFLTFLTYIGCISVEQPSLLG